MRYRAIVIIVAVLAVFTAACSEDNEVGAGVKVEKSEGGAGARLGETTTTQAPATTAAVTATTAAPATTAPKPTTTQAPATTAPVQAFEIAIYSDTSGKKAFEPPQAGVRRGTTVRWVNKDSIARSVESTSGAFASGPIAPGGSWEYKATTAGTYDYQDGTRPYATGQLVVG